MPDAAYLTEYAFRERTIEITGLAPSASQLLPVLEASPLFSGVEFSAPIVAQGAGLERFRIRLRLEAPPVARAISRRERLFLLAALAALGLYFGARPLLPRLAQLGPGSEKLYEEKAGVLEAYRQAVGREGALSAESAGRSTSRIAAHEEALLPGATPPLAAADLQTRLKQLAERAGLKIQSEKILAHVKRDAYLEIPVQIVANGEIRNLKDFVVAVEASPVFIAVHEMSLRSVKRRQFVAETRTYTDVADLQASMTLVGLIRGERE